MSFNLLIHGGLNAFAGKIIIRMSDAKIIPKYVEIFQGYESSSQDIDTRWHLIIIRRDIVSINSLLYLTMEKNSSW